MRDECGETDRGQPLLQLPHLRGEQQAQPSVLLALSAAVEGDRCENPGCVDMDLQLLQSCRCMMFVRCAGRGALPLHPGLPHHHPGMKVEHAGAGCKYIICRRCEVEFCFVCLKVKQQCLQTSSYFVACSSGIAPRQTSIPKWKK
ncbi:hypothetical protein NHX12_013741 [Muraenolepis orangiensis]|uniref:RBR-type E3 ubiquitin transferase n=1 Tax=Muraenolepis orangiensis TaxID=630683 RepID=A0A9Q0DCD1_9TELE|nr:hypothetical protein NHX12_013741 [Muraenolepis orangiensis]